MPENHHLIAAQADLHHQYFLGLQLMVSTREGPSVIEDWIFRLFRSQHEAKFLSSFQKLGLEGQSDAVACAKYHVLSNGVGGVRVEYTEESETKAWVRFRYPRWMFDGAALCGIPIEASRGFLRGWYGHNGVSLKNPRLGFVCVSEDMSGQYGLCGYFKEHTYDLAEHERLQFAPDELPPPFDPAKQPEPPVKHWSEERLAKANRNYSVEYIRNGIRELVQVVGRERARELGALAARLTGLQYYPRMAAAIGAVDGDVVDAARFLAAMFEGMGDDVELTLAEDGAEIRQSGLRAARRIEGEDRVDFLHCWVEIWRGAVNSHRTFMDVEVSERDDTLIWQIRPRS